MRAARPPCGRDSPTRRGSTRRRAAASSSGIARRRLVSATRETGRHRPDRAGDGAAEIGGAHRAERAQQREARPAPAPPRCDARAGRSRQRLAEQRLDGVPHRPRRATRRARARWPAQTGGQAHRVLGVVTGVAPSWAARASSALELPPGEGVVVGEARSRRRARRPPPRRRRRTSPAGAMPAKASTRRPASPAPCGTRRAAQHRQAGRQRRAAALRSAPISTAARQRAAAGAEPARAAARPAARGRCRTRSRHRSPATTRSFTRPGFCSPSSITSASAPAATAGRAPAARSAPTQVGATSASSSGSSPTRRGVRPRRIDPHHAREPPAIAAGQEMHRDTARRQPSPEIERQRRLARAAHRRIAAADAPAPARASPAARRGAPSRRHDAADRGEQQRRERRRAVARIRAAASTPLQQAAQPRRGLGGQCGIAPGRLLRRPPRRLRAAPGRAACRRPRPPAPPHPRRARARPPRATPRPHW